MREFQTMTQDTALSILKTGKNIFLTGEPGSGKTHTINRYVSYLKEHGVEPAITASTGIAATHIDGMTIHSWSGIGIKKELSPADFGRVISLRRASARVKKAGVLIIDEISILDSKTLNLIDTVCRAIKRSSEPFGGIRIVLVGDFFQLPPVRREEEEPYKFAFESEAWITANLSVCYLTEQHRQSDSKFLEVLSAIRSGQVSQEHRQCLNGCLADSNSPRIKNVTKFFPHNEDVNRINAEELQKLPGKSKSFVMTGRGKDNLVEQLKRGCLSPENLELKKGAIVMFTKNNFQRGFVNGTIGTIAGFDQYEDENYPIVRTRQGRQLTVASMEWTIEENGEAMAKIKQVPLRLAWAMTIHKSQGITLDQAFMDLNEAFVDGQGYVALSRVKTLDGLYLAGYNDKALSVHPIVLRHDDIFRQLSGEAESAHVNLDREEIEKFHDNFIAVLGCNVRAEKEVQDDEFIEFEKSGPNFYRGNHQENTVDETFNLISAGKTIAEVSQIRGRTEETIIKHLEDLKSSGKLSVDQIIHLKTEAGDNAINEIQEAFSKLGVERLKPVFDHFEGRYSYKSIRLVHLLMSQ